MAAVMRNDGSRALFRYDVVQRTFAVFTDEGDPQVPVWSPDGSYVYFSARGDGGSTDIYRRRADLSAPREEVLAADGNQVVTAISPDGALLVYSQESGSETETDIWAVPAEPGGEAHPLIVGQAHDYGGALSPDGEWLAYTTRRSGDPEVWLRRLDGQGPGQKASSGRGLYPVWNADGNGIFYNDNERLFSVRTELASAVRILPQERVPFNNARNQGVGGAAFGTYDDGDGAVFVMSDAGFAGQSVDGEERIIVVLNWLELLPAANLGAIGTSVAAGRSVTPQRRHRRGTVRVDAGRHRFPAEAP